MARNHGSRTLFPALVHPPAGPASRPGLGALLALVAAAGAAHAQAQFEERLPRRYLPIDQDFTVALGVADLDGDGDLDLLAANSPGPRLYLNQGQGVHDDFSATNLPASLSSATALVVGDLDQDGDADALFGSSSNAATPNALLINDGNATFVDTSLTGLPATFHRITGLHLGDVDGNGTVDVVASMSDVFQSAGVYLGDGLGSFVDASPTSMPFTNTGTTNAVDVGDVDGDGDLDLALASDARDRIYENNGLGVFSYSLTNVPNQGYEYSEDLVLVDVDLDGDRDLAVANNSKQNALHLNNGDGTFSDATALLPPDGDFSLSVAAGDLDGDGAPDLVFGNYGLSRTYQNDGAGAFADWPQTRLGSQLTYEAVLADIDLDGDSDLLLGNLGQDHVLFNGGDGMLFDATPEHFRWSYYDRAAAFQATDVDGDGDRDLLVAGGLYGAYDGGSDTKLLRAERPGEFAPGVRIGPSLTNTVALATGDVDGDADQDVVFGNAMLCGLGYIGVGCAAESNRLYLNDGQGTFAEQAGRLPADADDTFAVVLGDVDGDLDLDLIAGNWQQQSRLYRNDGTGTFTDATAGRLPARADRTRALVLADLDGDTDLDIVVGNDGQQDRQYVNEGLGAFFDGTAARMPNDTRKTRALSVVDIDLDGDLDLALGRNGQPGLYLNDGTGKLLDRSDRFPVLPDDAWAIVVGDLDDDGDPDVLLGEQSAAGGPAGNRLLVNDGSARFTDASATRLPPEVERTAAVALVDVDGDGDLDLFAGVTGTTMGFFPYNTRLYLNLHRQLEARLLPVIGRTWELELHAQPGYSSAPLTALVALSLSLLPTPVPDPVMGTLYLADPLVFPEVLVPSPQGSLVIPIGIPPAPGLYGLTFYAQGAILEQGGLRLTGYLEDTFWR